MDPLKPFSSTIRSVWDRTVRRSDAKEKAYDASAADRSQTQGVAESPPIQPLHVRVRTRIAQITQWDAEQAREIFVESVLLAELGPELANDPSFAEVVRKISLQLKSDARVSTRLDTLLKEMAPKPALK